ncbi:MAG: hypothetical protein WC877_03760 [Dehalococcoidales bacterium]|jgi:uncharacterized membrane protein YfcA
MGIFSNKMVVAIVCIIAGFLILPFLPLPEIISWIIGIFLIVYGVLVLLGKKSKNQHIYLYTHGRGYVNSPFFL